ncbi:hypothetical protein [Streptomyces sp. enrichment culture]|uniref:hypothetical protein n=1 Tax=Streptomyces sp. enrichment culture TaxID=1795815 RepID=UPI003F56F639
MAAAFPPSGPVEDRVTSTWPPSRERLLSQPTIPTVTPFGKARVRPSAGGTARGGSPPGQQAARARRTLRRTAPAAVTALHDRSGVASQRVYDLTVNGLHTFYVRPQGGQSGEVLVHNCLNLVGDEGVEGAHTLRDHVNPADEAMPAEAAKKGAGHQMK